MNEEQTVTRRRRVPGGAILAVIALLLIVQFQLRSVERIYCEDGVDMRADGTVINHKGGAVPDVLMLGAVWCPFCKAATRYLTDQKINFCELDVETNATGKRLYETLEGSGVPVLVLKEYLIKGYDEKQVEAALKRSGLLAD